MSSICFANATSASHSICGISVTSAQIAALGLGSDVAVSIGFAVDVGISVGGWVGTAVYVGVIVAIFSAFVQPFKSKKAKAINRIRFI